MSEFTVTISGIDKAIKDLESYKVSLIAKKREFLTKLAEIGIETATIGFSNAIYDGDNDVVVQKTPEWIDENTLQIVASGTTVLFIEFGSGLIATDYGKPYGYGGGTYSDTIGKGHWDNPNGWYYAHDMKSYGNPPARAMWEASKEIKSRILEIAKEVYGNG